ncbi:MAG: peptidase [Clostridiaceae bacterium]|nr:peptidase [Clostridiaceae bacterium]
MRRCKLLLIAILCFVLYGLFTDPSKSVNIIKGITMQQMNTLQEQEHILDNKLDLLSIAIGDTEEKVIEVLGEPNRKDMSKYGFQWYIYNEDYVKYLQVGIKKGMVVGLYTNSSAWQLENTFIIGLTQDKTPELFGTPLEYIKKGNTLYYLNNTEYIDTYFSGTYYITIFYDIYNENKVTAIKLIEKNIEENLLGFYGEASEVLGKSFERQIYDLANAVRAREGKPPFQWDDRASLVARGHSEDMKKHHFFNHENLQGEGPSQRMEKEGIPWRKTGENIAAGQTSAIFAHEAWMNSSGHRENILDDFARLGVGVHFGGDYEIYYTQKFYTPR